MSPPQYHSTRRSGRFCKRRQGFRRVTIVVGRSQEGVDSACAQVAEVVDDARMYKREQRTIDSAIQGPDNESIVDLVSELNGLDREDYGSLCGPT